MKISGVAIGQFLGNVKKKEGKRRTEYKIHRAIVLGKLTHVYNSGDYIVRYYDLNLLISKQGIVLTIWRDATRKEHYINPKIKDSYDESTTHKENIAKANVKHKSIINKYTAS